MKTDFEIQQELATEMQWEPELNAAGIGVSVNSGVAILSGYVDSWHEKMLAEHAVKRVKGVKAMVQEIKVKKEDTNNNLELASAVIQNIRDKSSADPDNIWLKVERGIVTLEGVVDWDFQRDSLTACIEDLPGISGVVNLVKIRNRITSENVKRGIADSLLKSARSDSDSIKVETEGNTVILSGTVKSAVEKEEAERSAWLSPGVVKVENRIDINPA